MSTQVNPAHPSHQEALPGPRNGGYASSFWPLADMAGGRHLGCSLYEVPAGFAAYPLHWHAANEEAIIILEGQGRLRIGEEEREVGPGHYIALPPGPAHAHQLIALTDLRYYCISTRISPEVVGYPDSSKVGAIVRQGGEVVYRGFFRMEDARPYFDGDPRAEKP